MKLSHLLGTIIVSALSSACALDHTTLPLKNSLDPKVLLPAPDVEGKGEHITRQVSTAYDSALESSGTDGAAAPRITPVSDRTTVNYHPINDGPLDKSKDDVVPLIDHGMLSKSGSAVSVLGLGETFSREKDGADIVSSYAPIHAGVRHDHAVIVVDRKLQSGPCPPLSAVEFKDQIIAYIGSCDQGACESASFGSKPINEWCTSSITDMNQAFFNIKNFNDDISSWDVSSVTSMQNMFHNSVFNQDLNTWDVSSVTQMYDMFHGSVFNQGISAWDVSSVATMGAMFKLNVEFNHDLNAWDVSSVTELGGMFSASYFNRDINAWDVSSAIKMYGMFEFAAEFNQDLCAWTLPPIGDRRHMFEVAPKFNQDLCAWGDTFKYNGSNRMFQGTACSAKGDPREDIQGPFCADCTTSTKTCTITTASPTTASPTTTAPTTTSPTTISPTTASPTTNSPTTSPTESPPWKIAFTSMSMDFNASTTNEGLILTYEVGKGKKLASTLYAGPCLDDERTMPTVNVVTKRQDSITASANPLMSTLELGYDVNKSLIATSNIWNDTTSQMKFCQVLQLVQNASQMEDDLVIIEDIRDVTIGINSFLNFSLGVDLVGAIVNAVNQTTSLADFISAYICSGDDAMEEVGEGFELEPNEDLHVCFMSKSTDVKISQVTSMTIEGTDATGNTTELSVVADGEASITSITSLRYGNATSAICTTRVPINMFDYELADAKITIKGSVTMNFQGNAEERKLLIENQISTKNRDLQQLNNAMDEEAQFGISVNLKRSDIVKEEQISFLNSASKIFASIGPLVVVVYAIW